MIKVMIVDDSALVRRILTEILNSDKDISVIGTARNGKEALEKIEILNPDVITLDIEMPIMDGITTLEYIVSNYNIPVVMISKASEKNSELVIKSLEIGAESFLSKPNNIFKLNDKNISKEIIDIIKLSVEIKWFVS